MQRLLGVIIISVCFLLGGCSTVSYYAQSITGHSRLMLARQPVEKVIQTAAPELKYKLQLTQELRKFAVTKLGLPDNNSYQSYVALDREFPVWTVVAAPEFSLQPKEWCYAIIGCASYRGYFNKQAALRYAEKMHTQGYETTVGGAAAYSTLGWFSDPVLPSMLYENDAAIAELLFHELAHQQLYINGDSSFNEAFATVIGEYGTRQWLRSKNLMADLERYNAALSARDDFNTLLVDTKKALTALYAGNYSVADMSNHKSIIFNALYEQYELLRLSKWKGENWFAWWFNTPVNNARLVAFSTYRSLVPELQNLLAACNWQLEKYYQLLKTNAYFDKGENKVQVPATCVGGS